jgi:hypothetical protein
MSDSRPIVCVDLNGVLRRLHERGFRVVVFTTRWANDAWRWLAEHGLDRWVSEVTDRKPAAQVFVDDRAVCFRGDYEATLEEIARFRAHWEVGEEES